MSIEGRWSGSGQVSLDRFFVASPLQSGQVGQVLALPDTEAHHAFHVMRKKVGDEVDVFDGEGNEARGRIESAGRKGVEMKIESVSHEPRIPPMEIHLAVALPRAGGADDMLRRAVEVGVGHVIPLRADRSVHRPDKRGATARQEKFRRLAIAAMKQSGLNVMPTLADPMPVTGLSLGPGILGVFGSTGSNVRNVADLDRDLSPLPRRVVLVVGPEGGLTPREEESLTAAGFCAVSLGERILRVETAVIALASRFASIMSPPVMPT